MLKSGTKLGRYEVQSLIGSGGMGEVYLARDPKIGRDVAIKVLPSSLAGDRERLARFEQEAQAAGTLNHPNILAIYDVDSDNGTTYVVSELLKGETLRETMGGTPLPLRKAVEYGLQTAHGLAAAHEKGIIHRDIKPENLFVTSDGRVKILDFGLAKLTEANGDGLHSDLPTRKVNTDSGAVMGTVGYMSPEQLRGSQVDARTDIFSFGTVLYEMLSGRKAFQRDSTADTISAILREDPPDLSDTNSNVSPGLERVIRRCLEKNREARFHSASDLAFALEAMTNSNGSGQTLLSGLTGSVPTVEKNKREWLPWMIAGLLLLSTVAFATLYLRRSDAAPTVARFSVLPPEKMTLGDAVAISPDGRKLALVINSESGEPSLWLRSLDSLETQRVPGTEGAFAPFWSPDSKYIGFFAATKLKKVDANGGPIQTLADASVDPRGGSWNADGTIIYSPITTTGILRVSANGGPTTQVTEPDQQRSEISHRWPVFLPDGKHFLFFARGSDKELEGVFVGSIDSPDKKFLFSSKTQAIYARPQGSEAYGQLLFVRDGTLLRQPFDADRLELKGDPVTVAQNVRSFPTEVGPTAENVVSVSDDGHLVYRVGAQPITQLEWVDRSGKGLGIAAPPSLYSEPMISSDGKRVAVSKRDGNNQDIWLLETTRNVMSRFTFDASIESSQVWSRDGSHIYFSANRDGKFGMYRKASNGLGSEEMLFATESNVFPDCESPDGKYLIFEKDDGPKNKFDIWAMPLFGDRTLFSVIQTDFTETHASISPDGRWVMYSSDESGRSEVYVQSFPSSGGKWQVSTAGGDQAMWNQNGKEIIYLGFDRNLYSVPYTSGSTFEAGQPTVLLTTRLPQTGLTDERNNYLISPDGQRFMLNNLVDENLSTPLIVVMNWASDLKK